ncbi:MAG: CDP-diacylglycerol--glycerol-3-phosphate 3-phosphatidyltransferase [Planctomycetota bacterium]|jgi:CDP-diacylglycerol--glycerol-3-phosphate 3-phosphatidyltransferase
MTTSPDGTKPPTAPQPAGPFSSESKGTQMSTEATRPRRSLAKVFNFPNQLTSLRLILSVVLFCLIALEYYLPSFVLFIIAAGTDWLDGYYARKYGQVTTLGRILDPFADKVTVCGTFIFLVAVPAISEVPFGLRAWMVVVIMGRELLVTALRSFIEERGSDFSAKMSGKLKMFLQCIAASVCLYYLYWSGVVDGRATVTTPPWSRWVLAASVWSAVVLTAYSCVVYVVAAVKLLRSSP